MRNPGILVKLPDQRKCIVYDNQPLAKTKGVIVLHLIGEDYNLLKTEEGKPRLLLKPVHIYNEEMQHATLIGYVD